MIFFNSHLKGTLYTENVVYDIKVLSYAVVLATEDYIFDLYRIRNQYNPTIIDLFRRESLYFSEEEVSENDKLLVLSTCDSLGSYKRAVLFTKIVESTEEKEITQMVAEEKKSAEIMKTSQAGVLFQLPFSYRKLAIILLSIFVVCLFLSFVFRLLRLRNSRKDVRIDKEII